MAPRQTKKSSDVAAKKVSVPPSTPVSKKLPSRSPILTRTRARSSKKDEAAVVDAKSSDESDAIEIPSGSSEEEEENEEEQSEAESDQELEGFEETNSPQVDTTPSKKQKKESTTSQQNIHSITKPLIKLQSSNSASNKSNNSERGVIYVGRIPHGFYEDELRKYFKQFGEITRLRLSRNKKTGKSKHYGFIEFQFAEVAKIACETMNNYLIFNHLLKCSVLPQDKVHDELFQGANLKYKPVPWSKVSQVRNDKTKSKEQWTKIQKKYQLKNKKRQAKLLEQGIDYDLSAL